MMHLTPRHIASRRGWCGRHRVRLAWRVVCCWKAQRRRFARISIVKPPPSRRRPERQRGGKHCCLPRPTHTGFLAGLNTAQICAAPSYAVARITAGFGRDIAPVPEIGECLWQQAEESSEIEAESQ